MLCGTCQASIDGTPKFCPVCGSKVEGADAAAAAAPPVDPFLGKTIGGRYRVQKLLGEGGMGAVYLAEQNIAGTAKKFAVKTLHPHMSKDPKILARFERECGTVAGLSHPNVIQLVDFGKTDDGTLYMVMEFVQGRSLASVLEEQRALEPKRATRILQQICDALAEAHAAGIVHRDLKPENIVLTESAKDFVKVLDFGIAKRGEDANSKEEEKLTQQGTVLGTPPYMSPEQFTGRPIDLRSDLYSIGMMTYEMLAGRLPFEAGTAWEWANQHMTAQPLPLTVGPSGAPLPGSMCYAVMRVLAKDPAQRFASATEFFEAFAAEAPVTTGSSYAALPPQVMTTAMPSMAGGQAPGLQGTVPAMPAAYPPTTGAAVAITSPTPARSAGKKGSKLPLILGGVGLVVVLAGVGVAGVTLNWFSAPPAPAAPAKPVLPAGDPCVQLHNAILAKWDKDKDPTKHNSYVAFRDACAAKGGKP